MIVTIDGPAGAGKSTVAIRLADRLGYRFLNTGAMYRAVALAAIQADVDWSDSAALAALAESVEIKLEDDRVLLNGEDVSRQIRSSEVTRQTRFVADHPDIRGQLVALQRKLTAGGNYVTDGRDQGTVAFPQADCKIYLTASPEERARRRQNDLQGDDNPPSLEQLIEEQTARDQQDASRPVGPLRKADDAIEIVTDEMTIDEVVDHLESLVRNLQKQ